MPSRCYDGRRSGRWASPTVLVVLLLSLPVLASGPDGLSDVERRGRHIYREGASLSGAEIVALMPGHGIEISATVLPCVRCHGEDGRGGDGQGSGTPSDITWGKLTRLEEEIRSSGRAHSPYTMERLAQAISNGVDPAGNPLHVAMPRYRMTDDDMNDLVAYLTTFGSDDP